ncbi:hypothetical protein DTL42_12215 [Bremerella cremea]|uniref:Squalene cyclase C-terminal domain-containing protein n=1 Tax=Bremerella cremea TaxID=1031537 RepID=A0A368KR15_9BACT|nr:prenyltransferase/squalene oxidase repeat-containing protein [Bremerella cremea]RCS49293.1 hypothetical protein DTL42_12215 [Bremerella cremea]
MAHDQRTDDETPSFSPPEKAWPVYVAFTLFMLYFGAASYLLFDWNHELWYFDAKVYVGFAVVAWLVGMAMIPLLDISSVRRGIQLSLVLSLMVHLSLFIGIVAIHVGDIADSSLNQNQEKTPRRRQTIVPDYSPAQISEDREAVREYEQPVETREAEAEVDPLEQEKLEHDQPEMNRNEVAEKLPREIEPEEINKKEQETQPPQETTLDQLPSQLAKQMREIERQAQQAQQIEVQRQEELPPEIAAAQAEAQRAAQALEMQRQAARVQEAIQRATEMERRETAQNLPELSAAAANQVERQRLNNENPASTQAEAAAVQQWAPQQVQAQAQTAQLARQQSPQPASQPHTDVAPATSSAMANSMALNRNSANVSQPRLPSSAPRELGRNASANNFPTINTNVADNFPRPLAGESRSAQLRPATGSVARQEVGGDGVAANAVNPGQLWARPATAGPSAQMVEQHGATRGTASREAGIATSELSNPSLGRSPATGSQAMVGPGVKIEFQGPTGAGPAAAGGLADGQFSAPSMNIGRTAGNGVEQFGGGQVGGGNIGAPGMNLGSGFASAPPATTRRGDSGPSLQEVAAGSVGLSSSRTPGRSPVVGITAEAAGTGESGAAIRPNGADTAGVPHGIDLVPELRRRSLDTGTMPSARPGAGDLAGTPPGTAPQPGFIGRRRMADVPQIGAGVANLPVRSPGRQGPLLSTQAAVPTEAFSRRAMRKGGGAGEGTIRPSRETEEAIERGLAFLARHQSSDGRWSLRGFAAVHPENYPIYEQELDSPYALNSDTAATGLALLAFLGAGYDHLNDKYQQEVNDGIQFLLKHQKPTGDLYIEMDEKSNASCRLYSHAIAALALSEAYGMTQDEKLREPAQRSLDFIELAQDPNLGGWRYTPRNGSDTSVTGWMTLALKSGQLAGLRVDPKTFDGIRRWLRSAESRLAGRAVYVYNPYAPDTDAQRKGRLPSQTMTAVGALIQLYTGNRRDSRVLQDSADYLKANLPQLGTRQQPLRDTYYWYYATQVMFHMRGEYWEAWDNNLHVMLEQTQEREGPAAGSWDPNGSIPDRWAPFAGRIYVTTMNLLSLEVYHRHLPIYDDVGR